MSREDLFKIDPDFTYDRNESILDLRLACSKERDYLYCLDLDLVWNMHEYLDLGLQAG